MSVQIRAAEAFLEDTSQERLDELIEFLRIPTIGVLSEHHDDVLAGAAWLADRFRTIGLENVDISDTGGRPVVYADWLHAEDAPTVIVYCHYDVQPVDPLDLWVRPPFEPRVENGRIYARGAADDKGQAHLHLWAVRALLETAGSLPVNVRYVFEGEEEAGSPNFEAWLEANRDRLEADVVIVSDTSFYEGNHPALTVGLRGNTYLQIDVNGPRQDLHSGSYGGMVQNPAIALTQILASLCDTEGRITVPGFYAGSPELSDAQRAEFARLPFDEAAFAAEIGVIRLFGEPGFSPLERKGARPTLDICGIWSGFQGEGVKTIIPAHAHAKISCRLPWGMDPMLAFQRVRDAVLAVEAPGVEVQVTLQDNMEPFVVDATDPAALTAAVCLKEVFGEDPYLLYEGGSIGAVASFDKVIGAPVVMLGFANPDDQAHAPNESLVLANYEGGIRTMIRYFEALGVQA